MKRTFLTMMVVGTICSIAGCAVGPDYRRSMPDTAALKQLPSAVGQSDIRSGVPVPQWWMGFDDPVLNQLIVRSWNANYDIGAAASRYESAIATVTEAGAAALPELSVSGAISRAKTSTLTSMTGIPTISSPTLVGGELDWELDLFGRIRRGIEAARADARASAEARDDMRRLVTSQVAVTYIELREAQQQYADVRVERDIAARTAELVSEREAAGRANRFDVDRANTQLNQVDARLAPLDASIRAMRDRLATLTALPLDAPDLAALDRPVPVRVPDFVMTDDPAGLLSRRPDVWMSEQQLAAQTARIGVATADLYPRITLSGLIGLGSLSPGQIYNVGSKFWSGGAAMSWSLFNGGALRARVRAVSGQADAALAEYDKTVTTALEEADVALESYVHEKARNESLRKANDNAYEALTLAQVQYRDGRIGLLDLLDIQRTHVQTDQAFTESSYALARDIVLVYTAFAGGLDVPASGAGAVIADDRH